jgi:uncharacterized damage-inducible protein DinB
MTQEQLLPRTMRKENSLVYLMKNYANYNFWANLTLINWLKNQPEALLAKEVPSSFRSVKLTLAHILQTQKYWYSVISKTQFEFAEYEDLQEIYDALLSQSEILADYINTMEQSLLEESVLVESPWFTCDFENFEYILQVFNHSTYHRGQVITICHNLGITGAPMTDYNYYNIMAK